MRSRDGEHICGHSNKLELEFLMERRSGPLRVWPTGLLFSRQQVLQRRIVEHRFRQKTLELAVLLLQLLQALRIGNRHAAEFRLPVVVGRLRDPVPAAQLCWLRPRLAFFSTPITCSSVNRFFMTAPCRNGLYTVTVLNAGGKSHSLQPLCARCVYRYRFTRGLVYA